jgi:hypothetical protein
MLKGGMTQNIDAMAALPDDQLIAAVKAFASNEHRATARLIAALGEMDARKLFLPLGCSSMYTYCTNVLHLAEGAAFTRIEVARIARRWPIVLERLADGSVNLTTIRVLAPRLTDDNHVALLAAASHKTKREVEQQAAALRPLPAVASTVRRLPAPRIVVPAQSTQPASDADRSRSTAPAADLCAPHSAASVAPAPTARRAEIVPLALERFKVQITITRDAHDKLRRAQELLRHVIPNGDPAAVFERALTVLVADLEKRKLAETTRPRPAAPAKPGSRHVPAAIRREVWKRDGAQCVFVGPSGRCTERGFLEFHHVTPFADGGETTVANLELRCRPHNAYEAHVHFGSLFVRERSIVYGQAWACRATVHDYWTDAADSISRRPRWLI